jgi:hypothetical protein
MPRGETLIISFGLDIEAFQSLRAPTLELEVMKSPEMLSAHATAE